MTSKAFAYSAECRATQAEETSTLLQSIAAAIRPWKANHPYAIDHGLQKASGNTLTGSRVIAGVDCTNAAALVIRDADGNLKNALCCVRSADGIFEDVLVPGATVAKCYGRIGSITDVILVAEDYPSGLALNLASGFAVAVALFAANIPSVCYELRKKYPNAHLIICPGIGQTGGGQRHAAKIIRAAQKTNAKVAYPDTAPTFIALHQVIGPDGVWRCIEAAVDPNEFSIANQSDHEDDTSSEPDRWATPVNGAALIVDILQTLRRFVVLRPNALLAICLWVIFTHVISVVRVAPILVLWSPVKRCAKTTLLGLIARLVRRPLTSSNLTPAVVFRTIDAWKPTLVIDEADTFFEMYPELIGVVNSGHTRDTAYVQRIGPDRRPYRFSTFCPKAIAGIGKRAATVMDRAIVIAPQRRRPEEMVEKHRLLVNDEIAAISARIARWAEDNLDAIESAQYVSPDLRNDRAEDNWEPLLAIAHCLGNPWFDRATQAAIDLTVKQDNTGCSVEELLRDIKAAFDSAKVNKLATRQLIELLCADPEKPWGSYNRGKPIGPREISKLLDPFGIESKDLRFGQISGIKGYDLASFEDVFARYVPNIPA